MITLNLTNITLIYYAQQNIFSQKNYWIISKSNITMITRKKVKRQAIVFNLQFGTIKIQEIYKNLFFRIILKMFINDFHIKKRICVSFFNF